MSEVVKIHGNDKYNAKIEVRALMRFYNCIFNAEISKSEFGIRSSSV